MPINSVFAGVLRCASQIFLEAIDVMRSWEIVSSLTKHWTNSRPDMFSVRSGPESTARSADEWVRAHFLAEGRHRAVTGDEGDIFPERP